MQEVPLSPRLVLAQANNPSMIPSTMRFKSAPCRQQAVLAAIFTLVAIVATAGIIREKRQR